MVSNLKCSWAYFEDFKAVFKYSSFLLAIGVNFKTENELKVKTSYFTATTTLIAL